MTDFKMKFVRDLEERLSGVFDSTQLSSISNAAVKALANYELTDRCTDIMILDDFNERTLKRYKACLIIDGKSENTIKQYIRTAQKLSDMMRKPFNEMGIYDLRYFLAKELERGISAISLENTRANLSAFFQWLADDEVIQKNPASKIAPIKYHLEVKKAFSAVEIDALRSACRKEKERALIEFLLSTGVRVSELASMQTQDIDMNTLTVHVRHGKGNKERITYMNQVASKHLAAYLDSRKKSGFVLFYNKNGNPLQTDGIRFILNTIANRAGVENTHPHRFRRTFATTLASRGMNVQEIQRLLGHANINTTMQYISMDDGKIKNSYQKYIA